MATGGCPQASRLTGVLRPRWRFRSSAPIPPSMPYRFLADATVVLHGLFILFVVLGGFLAVRRPWVAALHLPCAAWGAFVAMAGWVCPLTPLENRFRQAAGEAGYPGGFIETYLIPLIYPGALTREIQVGLGVMVILVNLMAYGWLMRRWRRGAE